MTVFRRLLAASLLAGGALLPAPASAQPPTPPIPGCTVPEDALPSGGYALICVPPANLTNGNLSIPLVTVHTTRDELIPFWHELLYLPKVDLSDRGRFLRIPVARSGHGNLTVNDVVAALGLAVRQP